MRKSIRDAVNLSSNEVKGGRCKVKAQEAWGIRNGSDYVRYFNELVSIRVEIFCFLVTNLALFWMASAA
jgi:hypothetical protein